ncbi:MAG TPA: hypothetical protein VMD58_03685 [Acidobacteriaceae bacterium]|nr:hypothetical protein [Acidobacteriaceae bacterium]
MKVTIDNLDGKGAVDYSQCVVATEKFIIRRQLNEPSLCSLKVAPSVASLTMPVRNGRLIVSDDNGTILFTGYLPTEPALELVGQGSAGAVYQGFVSAVSDEILLDQQPLPLLLTGSSQSAGELVQSLSTELDTSGFSFSLSSSLGAISSYLPDTAANWSSVTGAVAAMSRSAYRVVDGVILMEPIGSVVHTLSEANGTLDLSALQASMVKALANDVTVCGPTEPAAYVTEYFQGDGTTVLFDLTEEPYLPSSSATKPFIELFQEPQIDTAVWQVIDTGSRVSLTSAGLTCTGGNGADGGTTVSTVDGVEFGGSLVLEAGGVLFGSITEGILNGIYGGSIETSNCVAGFQISQANGNTEITALIEGAAAGSPFTATAGHMYTLRLRVYCNEMQRVMQMYLSVDESGQHSYGGLYMSAGGSVVLEVQDTTDGVAGTPVVLYSGSIANLPSVVPAALLNSANLDCSIASFEISQDGPIWVVSTPPNGSPVVRRLGTVAQGADCRMERMGRLQFYPTSIPQAGELVAVSYRTRHRSVARQANAASITEESNGGVLPGTAAWIGTVTSPGPRSSLDCENAASALLDLSTDRGAAWKGTYTAWNLETQSDVWPGDLLAVSSTSANMTANLVVRTVELELSCSSPGLVKYVVSFANDWADALAIKTSSRVPADVWLPQQPETTAPLANLNELTISSVTSSAITVDAVTTPPANGGFEVRRRDWAFGPGTDSDLVLRSPVNNFTIPREAAMERYYIRMYDGSTPPNYSRFSSAVIVNVAL